MWWTCSCLCWREVACTTPQIPQHNLIFKKSQFFRFWQIFLTAVSGWRRIQSRTVTQSITQPNFRTWIFICKKSVRTVEGRYSFSMVLQNPEGILIKKKIKFRREQLQSHIWLSKTNGLGPPHIWGNIYVFPQILVIPSSYMTLQLLHSEFPYIWGKFEFLFCQCIICGLHPEEWGDRPVLPCPLSILVFLLSVHTVLPKFANGRVERKFEFNEKRWPRTWASFNILSPSPPALPTTPFCLLFTLWRHSPCILLNYLWWQCAARMGQHSVL